jgi:CheY-like chemotaxis protein
MHALIIEDEPMTALLIEDSLRALGYETVDFAATEPQALLAAADCRPDLITAEADLAEGSGIAAAEAIRDGAGIAIVYITASGWKVRERVRDAVIVAKPCTAGDLERALEAATIAHSGPRAPNPIS